MDQTELGTTTANASGTWSYTTGSLGSGTQVFTATATDAAGNTSALSNSVDPIMVPTTTTEIDAVYSAVLQRSPSNAEVTASLAIESTLGSAGMIAAIVEFGGGDQQRLSCLANVRPGIWAFSQCRHFSFDGRHRVDAAGARSRRGWFADFRRTRTILEH